MKIFRRAFYTGAILQIITCPIHLLGHFQKKVPANDQERTLLDLLDSYKIDFGAGSAWFQRHAREPSGHDRGKYHPPIGLPSIGTQTGGGLLDVLGNYETYLSTKEARLSADVWSEFAREIMDRTGIDLNYRKPGGFQLFNL